MEINKKAAEFFKCTSLLNASILLNSLLEAERIECSVSNAVVTALIHGSLLWASPMQPSGLACSVLTSEDITRQDTLYEGIVLDISIKFEMSSASLEKMTKTQVKLPVDIDGVIDRIRALQVLTEFLFGPRIFGAQGLRGLSNKCLDNKKTLKVKAAQDSKFIAKFLCCIDDRLYQ